MKHFRYALTVEEETTGMMSQCQWQGGEGPDKQELTHCQPRGIIQVGSHPSSFELITAVAVQIFQEENLKKKKVVRMSFFQRIGSIVENVKVSVSGNILNQIIEDYRKPSLTEHSPN